MASDLGCERKFPNRSATLLLREVVAEDAPALRRYVQSQTRDAAETEDMMQDVYLRVLQNSELIERSLSRRAYLFRIARNLIRDRARHRLAAVKAMGQFRMMSEISGQHASQGLSSPQEQALRALQGSQAAARAMGRLKDKHREIYCLSRMEGLRNCEIADQMGVSLRSVERHVSEISVYMRETLASYI